MHRDDLTVEQAATGAREIDRRTIAKGVAWTVPVVIVATAAPAAASSPQQLPTVTAAPGTGVKGGTANARYVDFTVKFTSDRSATITLVSLTPDDQWSAPTGQTWPNKVVALAPGVTTVTFRLNRKGNSIGSYTLSYMVTGATATQSVAITIA